MHAGVGADAGVADRKEVSLRVEGRTVGHNVAKVEHLERANDYREDGGA